LKKDGSLQQQIQKVNDHGNGAGGRNRIALGFEKDFTVKYH
jgi:hypothetical protein